MLNLFVENGELPLLKVSAGSSTCLHRLVTMFLNYAHFLSIKYNLYKRALNPDNI